VALKHQKNKKLTHTAVPLLKKAPAMKNWPDKRGDLS